MRISIYMKTPDCLDGPAREYAEECLKRDITNKELMDQYDNQYHYYLEDKEHEFRQLCDRWLSYGEGITLYVDTEAKTIGVDLI